MASNPSIPPWLKPLLDGSYFCECETHSTEDSKAECNFFCLQCKGKSLCPHCTPQEHQDHPILQIRRSSYSDVVRVNEISDYIDASNIQSYRINNGKIIFLNERPIVKPARASTYACVICTRNLIDPCKFCSLGCKLEAVKIGMPGVTFEILPNKAPDATVRLNDQSRKRLLGRWIEEQTQSDGEKEFNPDADHSVTPVPAATSRRTHRRKGMPHRAPLY